MKAYFLILFVLVLIIAAHISIRSYVVSFGGYAHSSGYELAAVNFNFFGTDIKDRFISQGYGKTPFAQFNYSDGWHNGIDIVASVGAPVISPSDGIVVAVGDQDDFCYRRGFGKFVVVENKNDDKVLLYAHLERIKLKQGEEVKKGGTIGFVGATGFATAPHLHFSVFDALTFRIKEKNGCGPGPDGNDTSPFKYLDSILPGS